MQTVLLWVGWLLMSIQPVFYASKKITEHPLHVGVVEVNHNKAEHTLEVQCKLYTDDFETTLSRLFKRKIDLTNPAYHAAMDTLVERYLSQRVRLAINGKASRATYLGFEQEKEAVYAFIEISDVPNVIKEVQFDVSLLFDLYEDQINLVHVTIDGQRKSTKVDYPQSKGAVTF
jgi:hypothetical protein